jgi:hypothetical protein
MIHPGMTLSVTRLEIHYSYAGPMPAAGSVVSVSYDIAAENVPLFTGDALVMLPELT